MTADPGHDVLQIGSAVRSRRPVRPGRPRRIALLALALLLLASSTSSTWWLVRDRRETWTAAETRRALVTFRSSTATRELRVVDHGYGTPHGPARPCRRLPAIDASNALDAATWSDQVTYSDLPPELVLVRYADPSAARRALAVLRAEVRACAGSVVPDDDGTRYRVLLEGGLPDRWWGPRLDWSTQLADADGTVAADPIRFGAEARQAGNVVAVATGTSLTDLDVRRSLCADLVTALHSP